MSDSNARQQALDPTASFIIQAPAGSGKTELLTQRYLKLLSLVDQPESILAITFTRKAASEMRHRILQALVRAQEEPCPTTPHLQTTWQLAHHALQRNKACAWQLLDNPQRLNIQTIDAFCTYLTKKLPLVSRLGGQISINEQAAPFYQAATKQLLKKLSRAKQDEDFENLMLHLNNDWQRLESLMMSLLVKRDHWMRFLPYIQYEDELKAHLEKSFSQLNIEGLTALDKELEQHQLKSELLTLLQFAANYVAEDSAIIYWKNITSFPKPNVKEKQYWQGMIELLLTKEGDWRKQINKNQGFLAPDKNHNPAEKALFKAMKAQMLALLEKCQTLTLLHTQLLNASTLPPAQYSETQWKIILSLFHILPLGLEELNKVFREHGQVDFTEIALRALTSLGDELAPTQLALYLDYQIQHILIDEFQDTSFIQMNLLHKLIAPWAADDGKTLFLVGDPMQSIYRFRNAEVSHFLQIKQTGYVNHLPIQSLTLSQNFRSSEMIIDWINQYFARIFPKTENLNQGAVCYAKATPTKNNDHTQITTNFDFETSEDEAHFIIQKIQYLQTHFPHESIAVLVQTRNQLTPIISALNLAHITYEGVDLTKLANQPIIEDLLALTRALLLPYDRIAWLAILRAPWCGLALYDLYLIAQNENEETIWQRLNNTKVIQSLSQKGQIRAVHIQKVLAISLALYARKPLAAWIEDTWHDLGGAYCLSSIQAKQDCETYFQLLRKFQANEASFDLEIFTSHLQTIFTQAKNKQSSLQIMTIHKAKGLEFDHVILPGLEKGSSRTDPAILLWCERQNALQETDLLMGPIKASDESHDDIYDYLAKLEKARLGEERRRLFYVAVTRAKKTLSLTACIATQALPTESFLNYLEKANYPIAPANKTPECVQENTFASEPVYLQRLPLPTLASLSPKQTLATWKNDMHDFAWQASTFKKFGTVFHLILRQIAHNAQNNILTDSMQKSMWAHLLEQHYFPRDLIDDAIQRIEIALENTFNHPEGSWLLSAKKYKQNEFSLSTLTRNKATTAIVDQVFIDDQDELWVIDYKTSLPQNEPLAIFLEREKEKYQAQLYQYQQIIYAHFKKMPRIGLYFPLVPAWIEYKENTL